jgi:hypothetical protein
MLRRKLFKLSTVGLLLAQILTFQIRAAALTETNLGAVFNVTDENDAWGNFFGPHQDRHYTHGIKLTYLAPSDYFPQTVAWLNRLPAWGLEHPVGQVGFVTGQNMYTPEDILDPNPIHNDRPYAGWLYVGALFQRHGQVSEHMAVMENFEINLGIVGPDSYADDTQRIIHQWRFPEDIPQGWGNQIHDEPGLVLKYARLWRWSPTERVAKYFDLLPRTGFELGNVNTFATAGASFRIGYNLPEDFGVQIIDSPASVNGVQSQHSSGFSAYAFGGLDGRAVLQDIALDGNTFRQSASVDKYPFVSDIIWGFAVQPCRHLELSFTHVTRSAQFRGQQGKDIFGSLAAKLIFTF